MEELSVVCEERAWLVSPQDRREFVVNRDRNVEYIPLTYPRSLRPTCSTSEREESSACCLRSSCRGSAHGPSVLEAQAPAGLALTEQEARTWLTYLASDALQGREVFTEGYGMAAMYVADHLASWGVKPLGDEGTFLQSVKQRTYKVTRRSSVTIRAGGRSQTFRHGEHVSFPLESGGAQKLEFSSFILVSESRLAGRTAADISPVQDLRGKLVLYLPEQAESSLRRDAAGEDLDLPTVMVRRLGAAAVMTFIPEPPPRPTARGTSDSGEVQTSQLTTVSRVDGPVAPSITATRTSSISCSAVGESRSAR